MRVSLNLQHLCDQAGLEAEQLAKQPGVELPDGRRTAAAEEDAALQERLLLDAAHQTIVHNWRQGLMPVLRLLLYEVQQGHLAKAKCMKKNLSFLQ